MTNAKRAAVMLATVCMAGMATGQPIGVPRNARPPEAPGSGATTTRPSDPRLPPTTTTIVLSDQTLRLDMLGLTMGVPEGCVLLQGTTADGTQGFTIAPPAVAGAGSQAWTMVVTPKQTRGTDTTVAQTIEAITQQVLSMAPMLDPTSREMTHSRVLLLHREMDLRIPGSPTAGARVYFSIPGEGRNTPRLIKGFTVFKPLPSRLVIFELTSTDTALDAARAAYELSIATAKFTDPTAALAERAEVLANGAAFVGALSDSELLAAITAAMDGQSSITYRLYRPGLSVTEDEERGYRVVTFARGRRSDLGRQESMVTSGRDPEGIVMTLKARVLSGVTGKGDAPRSRGQVIDSETRAFISLDRQSEAWTTTTSVRPVAAAGESGGGAGADRRAGSSRPTVMTEIGVREGSSLSVLVRQPGQPDRSMQHTLQGSQYLSQVEVILLPTLMARLQVEGEAGFYAYRSDMATISLRRDMSALTKDQVSITTTLRDGDETIKSIVKPDGLLLRSELADGSIWEPIATETLLRMWRSKGLPTGE